MGRFTRRWIKNETFMNPQELQQKDSVDDHAETQIKPLGHRFIDHPTLVHTSARIVA